MSPERNRQRGRVPDNDSAVATIPEKPGDAIRDLQAELANQTSALARVLPNAMSPERFAEVVARAVAKDAKLMRCTPLSLMRSIMDAAALGFEPTGKYGGAYLVPFWNKDAVVAGREGTGAYEATMIPSYNGLTDLAYRSGIVTLIEGDTDGVVYEGDDWTYVRGYPETTLRHIRATGDRGEPIGAWCMVHLRGSDRPLIGFLDKDEIEKRRKVSKSGSFDDGSPRGIWRDWRDEMWAKTVLRSTLDLAPRAVLERVGAAYAVEDAGDSRLAAAAPAPQLTAGQSERRSRLLAGAVGAEVGGGAVGDGPDPDDAPGTTETGAPGEAAHESAPQGEPAGRPGEPDASPDNAGPRAAGEAPEAAQCGQSSPYPGDDTCYLIAGHPGTHRSPEATW